MKRALIFHEIRVCLIPL